LERTQLKVELAGCSIEGSLESACASPPDETETRQPEVGFLGGKVEGLPEFMKSFDGTGVDEVRVLEGGDVSSDGDALQPRLDGGRWVLPPDVERAIRHLKGGPLLLEFMKSLNGNGSDEVRVLEGGDVSSDGDALQPMSESSTFEESPVEVGLTDGMPERSVSRGSLLVPWSGHGRGERPAPFALARAGGRCGRVNSEGRAG
jgi:hypothetical protein